MGHANLVFIGDGDKNVTKYIKDLIDDLNISDKVFFLGRKDNPYKYLAKSGVLALSSHYEGTPNVIVESIAVGTPVVSSNCTRGIEELMSLKELELSDKNIIVESGIITPNLFKGSLQIPEDYSFLPEEKLFSEALEQVIGNSKYQEELFKNQKQLLNKFNLSKVSIKYLN